MNSIDDNRLLHSNEALNITHQFYDKKFMLYVEGEDDIVFWDENFRKYLPSDFYEIEPVNGKENLDRYIKGVIDGTLSNIVVACDSDYNSFRENYVEHKFVVRTYGHSIENTMFCPLSVAAYIRRASKTSNNYLPEVLEWLETFCSKAKKLIPYEIENEINPTHSEKLPKVFNMGFHYFQDNQNKSCLDERKINNYIQTIANQFDPFRLSEIEHRIDKQEKEIRFLIQGHFVASAIMEYIRKRVKQIKGSTNIPNDTIYESIVDCKYPCKQLCIDKQFLKSQIENIFNHYA
ncbi:MAG: DUF4435 domain-containing protein [Bacteroidaceae bacterium]|nr:DUF4435 domain-containing protein [Bacteroidaceae bacterium]